MGGSIAQLGEISSICLLGTLTFTRTKTHTRPCTHWNGKYRWLFGAFPGDTTPPRLPRPTSLVGGTYLIMCVIEKDATAVKEHTHASRKSCSVRKIKP